MQRGWYALVVESSPDIKVNREEHTAQLLRDKVLAEGYEDRVFQVLVPVEKSHTPGASYVSRKKLAPGQIFVDMILDPDVLWLIKSIPGVIGFFNEPRIEPLSEDTVKELLQLADETSSRIYIKPPKTPPSILHESLKPGDLVGILSPHALQGQIATVKSIDSENRIVKVELPFFGATKEFDVPYEQINERPFIPGKHPGSPQE